MFIFLLCKLKIKISYNLLWNVQNSTKIANDNEGTMYRFYNINGCKSIFTDDKNLHKEHSNPVDCIYNRNKGYYNFKICTHNRITSYHQTTHMCINSAL